MPTKSKKYKKTSAVKKNLNALVSQPTIETTSMSNVPPKNTNKRFVTIGVGVIVLAIVLGLIARRYKSVVFVANVNGMSILRSELNERLTSRFGTQMLEALIGEKLITQAAQKQNIRVSDAEVNAKISEIEKTLGTGTSLDDSLKLRGISKAEFTNQVKIQLMIDKLFATQAAVTTAEVDEFIKKNGASLAATVEAEKRIEAEAELKNQKVSQAFVEWFNQIKESAKVQRYL